MSESYNNTLYSGMTLLCVDDESIILCTLQRLFHRKSYTVFIADSAQNALEIMTNTPIDVIVSDIRMPEMDGATLLAKVANTYPDTYRIVLSGYADFESTVAAINLGKIHRFINKPWDNNELINAVEEGLERIRLTKENHDLKDKIENQNTLLKNLNNDLEDKINLRTKQIRASLRRNELNSKSYEKMLFNFIAINPNLSGSFAKNVGHLAGRLGETLNLDKDALHDIRLAGYLSEIGLLGMDPIFCHTPYDQLNFEEKKQFMNQGTIAQQILSPAQRLSSVTAILTHQFSLLDSIKTIDSNLFFACKILIIARDYWRFSCGKIDIKKMDHNQIIIQLNKSRGIKYAEDILDQLIAKPELIDVQITKKSFHSHQLLPQMILKHSLFSSNHLLILAEGHEFTENSIDKLIEYEINQKQTFVIETEE
jgi:response regulator RpfG family c-di-GMP phosphodiesterase